MSCVFASPRFAYVMLTAAAVLGTGCRKDTTKENASSSSITASPAGEATPSSVTTITSAGAAPLATRIQGTWSNDDGSDVLEITASTLRHRYKNIPGDRAAPLDYTVAKEENGGVLLTTHIVTPNGKKISLDPQAFTLLDADTLRGGNAKSKKFTTYKRSK
jgi:hypothetical protein